MLIGLGLFLADRQWSKMVLTCLLPVFAILPFFVKAEGVPGYAFYIGMVIICLASAVSLATERMRQSTAINGGEVCADDGKKDEEDDILNNKTKWRLIIAGYVIFILFAVFSIISIIRLNNKINTLYGFTQELDQRIEETEK